MTSTTTHVTNLSRYRWVILLMSWAAFTMTSVDRSTWGPASASVGESLAIPLAALGTFATAYYIGYVLSNLGGGVLVDWLGGRLILGVSGIGAGLFMFLFGSTTSFAMGLALQAALGLLAGVDFAAGLKLISTWFPAEKRGFAAGVFMTATSLGTVIANAVVPASSSIPVGAPPTTSSARSPSRSGWAACCSSATAPRRQEPNAPAGSCPMSGRCCATATCCCWAWPDSADSGAPTASSPGPTP